ncbi:MAG: pyridoxamine 5'-phosphate oxidase family protein [Hydrogenophaga sp.]|jgi:pyridoxine/pyridoxamine 5'-phosphate oxidase|nr:pyridoxamine 5'-phosphate oxidase family protein [Hydrogenophaga sp.]
MSHFPRTTEAELVQRIWAELLRATVDRHHEWRTPVLATTSAPGVPQARTVVLRGVDAQAAQLVVYTDRRSPKVAELQASPAAAMVFWSQRLKWQLRASVRAEVHTQGALVDAAWARVGQSAAAGDYLAPQAPGSPLEAATATGSEQHHLAVITAQVEELDWLALSREGHQRARVLGSEVQWLVP